jgi:hypothetical protein
MPGYLSNACVMVGGALNLGFNRHDLGASHDLSKFPGRLGFSALICIGGVAMILKSRAKR